MPLTVFSRPESPFVLRPRAPVAAAGSLMFLLLSSTAAQAACTPGTVVGEVTVTCTGSDGVGFSVLAGDNAKKTVNVAAGALVTGNIQMAEGNDWIANQGQIDGQVSLGSAQMNAIDRVTNAATASIGTGSGTAISGTAGRQELENLGLVEGGVSFGSDDDLVINEGWITGPVDLGSSSGLIAGDYLNSALGKIGSNGSGGYASTLGSTVIMGGAGRQRVTLGQTTWGNIDLGAGDDHLTVVGMGLIDGDVDLGSGNDRFELQSDGAALTGDLNGGDGFDALTFSGGAAGSALVQGSVNQALANLNSIAAFEALQVDGGGTWQVTDNLNKGWDTLVTAGTLEVLSGKTLTGKTLTVGSSGNLAGAGTATFTGSTAVPSVNNGTISIHLLQGDAGPTVFSNLGTVAAGSTVDLGEGSDTLLETGNIEGLITLGGGDDVHIQTSTPNFSGQLSGGSGNDLLQLNALAGGTINSANFIDFETLQQVSGSWTLTGTHSYSNPILVTGGSLTSGSDAHVTLGSGSMVTANVTGAAGGNQIVRIDGAHYTGTMALGDGDDQFILANNPTITGTLDGGSGSDDRLTLQGNGTLSAAVINVESARLTGDWTLASGSSYQFVDGFAVESGSLNLLGGLAGPLSLAQGAGLSGSGDLDGDLTIDGLYSGHLTLSAGQNKANHLQLNPTGTIAAGASVALGGGVDSFNRLGNLLGTVDFGAGADRYTYYSSDPALAASAIIDGGSDSDADKLILAGNRDGSAYTGAEISVNPAQFPNWDGLDVTGGDWAMTGTVTFDDGVDVLGGAFDVDGTLSADGAAGVYVGPNGTLGGVGTIDANVALSGTLSPAGVGEIGTLTIDGNLVMAPSGNLWIDASGNPISHDQLIVTGDAELDGTLTIAPLTELPPGMEISFLDVAGNVSGTFDQVVSSNGDLGLSLDMSDPNNPSVLISTQFGTAATETNLSNTGAYLDHIGTILSNDTDGLALQNALLNATGEDKRYILAQMSPDLYDQNTAVLFERNRHFQATMLEQLARCDVQRRYTEEFLSACNSRRRESASKANVWSAISGFSIDEEGDNRYLDYRLAGGAAQFGIDGQLFPGVIVGGSFAAGRSTFDNAIRGGGTTTDYDLGAYGQFNLIQERKVTVDLGIAASLGFGQNHAERRLDELSQLYEADFNTTRQSVGVVLGAGAAHRALFFGGKLGSNLSFVQREGFSETGNGSLTYDVAEGSYQQIDVSAEGNLGYRGRLSDDFYLVPKVTFGVNQLVAGDRREMDTKLSIASSSPYKLTVENFDPAVTFKGDFGLELQSRAGMLAFVKGGGSAGDGTKGRRFEGGIRLEF